MLDIFRNPPKNPEEWLKLLQLQETLHAKEMQKWQVVLQTAIELLRKVSVVCEKFTQDGSDGDKWFLIKDEL